MTAKLRQLNMVPSAQTTDAEFLRRVTIDTIGSLPSPDEVRAFLADPSPDKRQRKIDDLLAHPLACRTVGDQALRHHRQRYRRAGAAGPDAKPPKPDVA